MAIITVSDIVTLVNANIPNIIKIASINYLPPNILYKSHHFCL